MTYNVSSGTLNPNIPIPHWQPWQNRLQKHGVEGITWLSLFESNFFQA